MKIIYVLYRNRNVHSNEDFCEKSSLQAMWRVSWEVMTHRFTVGFVSGQQDLPFDAKAFSLTSFEA